uniref:Uncharacterized protein n=1 Tax=Rhizophora mucronata TaxID=61149 RepID=A0A2P2PFF9_RHIMU
MISSLGLPKNGMLNFILQKQPFSGTSSLQKMHGRDLVIVKIKRKIEQWL